MKFQGETIHRRELKNAPYNPRIITDKNRAKLKAFLKRAGLLEPPVWNRRSGNLVGGHQRIAALDALHGHSNYLLPVAVVDMSDREEKEANIALNNPAMQGEYEVRALDRMFRQDKIEFEAVGFDVADAYRMFGDSTVIEKPEALEKLADTLREGKEYSRRAKEKAEKDSLDYYLVVVFPDELSRGQFLDDLGVAEDRWVNGKLLHEKLLGRPL